VGELAYFVACVGVPHLRRQALVGRPDFRGPKFVRHVEDAAVHQGGETIAGHTLVSVPSLLEPSHFTAFRFEFSDGNLGVSLAGKVRGWPESPADRRKTNGCRDY